MINLSISKSLHEHATGPTTRHAVEKTCSNTSMSHINTVGANDQRKRLAQCGPNSVDERGPLILFNVALKEL